MIGPNARRQVRHRNRRRQGREKSSKHEGPHEADKPSPSPQVPSQLVCRFTWTTERPGDTPLRLILVSMVLRPRGEGNGFDSSTCCRGLSAAYPTLY
jgi:hypothetical protein